MLAGMVRLFLGSVTRELPCSCFRRRVRYVYSAAQLHVIDPQIDAGAWSDASTGRLCYQIRAEVSDLFKPRLVSFLHQGLCNGQHTTHHSCYNLYLVFSIIAVTVQ
jgi:hypothetical protein